MKTRNRSYDSAVVLSPEQEHCDSIISTPKKSKYKRRNCNQQVETAISPILKRRILAATDDCLSNSSYNLSQFRLPNGGAELVEEMNSHFEGDKTFADDSFLNGSIFGVLDDVEMNNAKNSPKFINESLNNLFEESFSVHEPVLNISAHSTPKRTPPISRKELIPQKDSGVQNGESQPSLKVVKVLETKSKKRKKPGKKVQGKKGFKIPYTNRKHVKLLSQSGTSELSRQELSSLSEEDKLQLSSWGLPESVVSKYRFKGVSSLFPWQLECLANEKVFEGRNLLYSAPTSAGKTLVAEILMLKRVLELGKKAIMILPFVSVAREKMYSLQDLFEDSGVKVEGFMGSYNPPGGFKAVDIAICTIEKANGLINRLLTEDDLSQLGTVVVDELHLVGDSHRGYLLELLLTKIKFMSGRKSQTQVDVDSENTSQKSAINIQIIGMSATLPNLPLLAKWLDAELVTTDYRPVPLVERLKVGDKLFDSTLKEVRPVLQESLLLQTQNDPDKIIYLSLETILNGHSVLIFCPTKAWCEKLAEQIAREFFNIGKPNSTVNPEIGKKLRDQLNSDRIAQVLEQLTQCPAGKDELLVSVAAFGVGFHHAGLTYDERDILEAAFKRGVLRVIVATSTLSAGVNLPARRVIISSPIFNASPLDPLTYKQMSGRAGRKGVDTEGESILICSLQNLDIGKRLVQESLPSVKSALLGYSGSLSSSLKRALLEVVASGVAKSAAEVHAYTKSTLLSVGSEGQQDLPSSQTDGSVVDDCLEFLVENEFIKLMKFEDSQRVDEYIATQLGSACLASSLSPDEGIIVYKELYRARNCFVLGNELHIIYQVTPIYLSDQWRNLDWNHFLSLFGSLNPEEQRVAQLVGVEERFILSALMSAVSWRNPAQRAKLSVHQRFFTALALNDLVNEMSIAKVTEKYGVTKGVVQNLQQAASTFAGMVTTFCARLGWSNLELLLSQFQERLQFGVQRELCDLVRLTLVNGQRARMLYDAGVQTVADLAACDIASVEKIFHRSGPFGSNVHGDNTGGVAMYILGKTEVVSQGEAARLVVEEARQFLQCELGLKRLEFGKEIRRNKLNTSHQKESDPQSETTSTIVGCQQQRGNSMIGDADHNKTRNENNTIEDQLMEIEMDLMDDSVFHSRTESLELARRNTSMFDLMVENVIISKPADNNRSSSATVSDFEVDHSINLFENSGPTTAHPDANEDVDIFGPTQKLLAEEFDHEMSSMDMSLSSFHLVDGVASNDNVGPEEPANPGSQPLFESGSSELFDTDEELPCDNVSITKTNKLHIVQSSSPDLFEEEFVAESAHAYATFKCHGKSIKLQMIPSTDVLPSKFFLPDLAISFGIKVKEAKKPTSVKIGGRVMNRYARTTKSDEEHTHLSVAVYNGGDTIWLYEEKFQSRPRAEEFKLASIFSKISETPCPVVMLDTKASIKNLVKCFGYEVLESILLVESFWDPKIAEWLCQGEGCNFGDDESVWVSMEKLMDVYLNDGERKVEDVNWPEEVRECYMAWIFMKKLQTKLENLLLWSQFKDIEMAALFPITFMELNGFGCNSDEFERLQHMLKLQAALLELKAFKIVGHHFNMSSSKDVHKVLFKDLKLVQPPKSRGTGKEVLQKIDHIVSSIILEWRKVHHALQLILPFSEAVNHKTGRIHGEYCHFTISGRIHMQDPSIQLIPRDFDIKTTFKRHEIETLRLGLNIFGPKINSLVNIIERGLKLEDESRRRGDENVLTIENLATVSLRNVFCAKSNEYVLLTADYSQLELRVLALLCKDRALTRTLNAGHDVFKAIASTWKGIPPEEVSGPLRQESKSIVYAIIYGMGKTTLSEKMGVTERVAEDYINGFMSTFPGVRKFINMTKTFARDKGYVETYLGRRRYLPQITSMENGLRAQAERQAVNFRVQGSASELVKKAMVRVQMRMDLLLKSKEKSTALQASTTRRKTFVPKHFLPNSVTCPCLMVLNLHDELIFEIRKDMLHEVVAVIREAMEKPFSVPVALPVNIKIGPTWGTLVPYENT